MKKKSKYLDKIFGNWKCIHVGVANIQPAYTNNYDENGKKLRAKYAGHRNYYYIFERLTSDFKAMKTIQLGYWQVTKVLRGECSVEDFANKKAKKIQPKYKDRVNYSFCK